MEEGQLHLDVALLKVLKEHHSALLEASVNSLNELAAADYSLIVPLDLEHPPVLLDVDGRLPLLLPVFLCLTTQASKVWLTADVIIEMDQ